MREDHAAIYKEPNSLEKWAGRSLMKINKKECQVLHLERKNPRHHQYMLGAAQLESSLAEGALSVLVSMDQLCALAAKKADGAASKCCHQVQGVDPFPLLKPGEAVPEVLCPGLGFPRELWP